MRLLMRLASADWEIYKQNKQIIYKSILYLYYYVNLPNFL